MIAFHVFNFVANIYLVEIAEFGETLKANYDRVVFGQVTAYILIVLFVFTFAGLIYLQRAISNCISKDYFNARIAGEFKYAGIFLLLSEGFGLIFNVLLFWKSEGNTNFGFLGMDFFMLIIAFSLYVIADAIENRSLMRQDNELAI